MTDILSDLLRMAIITPKGEETDLNDLAELMIEECDGLGMPRIKRMTSQAPEQDGESDCGYRLQARRLKFKIKARSTSPDAYYDMRDSLARLFEPADDPLILKVTLPNDEVRYLDCFMESGLTYPSKDRIRLVQENEINLIAPDPTFYDPVINTNQNYVTIKSGFEFPITFPISFDSGIFTIRTQITYAGSWFCYPIMYLFGPVSYPLIRNTSTGKWLRIDHVINYNEKVTIDLRYGYKTIRNNYGENLILYLNENSDLADFCLSHETTNGVNNIQVDGSGADQNYTRIELDWYDRYIGI